MLLSLNWLKDYVDIPKNISPQELGAKLTMHTVEIDDVIDQAEKFNNVAVGKILKIEKHPNADRLQAAQVDVNGDAIKNIVCGAPNIEVGQMVPVALAGAVLPNGLEIKKAKVRGVESEGMMCAEDELGLGDDHAGILILDNNAKIGQNFADYLGVKDVVFEVDNKSITNRPDLWGHIGYAREVAAFLEAKTTKEYQSISQADFSRLSIEGNEKLSVSVEDYKLCPRYSAVMVSGVKIKESPDWIKDRLIAAGVRPINNIVDITNFVMLELGQPMHAFDIALVSPKDAKECQIIVRKAKAGEKITTLDGKERDLAETDLVIANRERAIGIAGVMGAENSEINSETTDIILEAANFDPVSVRKTANRLNLRTDAAIRFEKDLDPNLCELAQARAVGLIKDLCPDAKISAPIIDQKDFELFQGPIEFEIAWLNRILGFDIKEDDAERILVALGFTIENDNGRFKVQIPTWRATKDTSRKEDIAEEIARIYGYGNIEPRMPAIVLGQVGTDKERELIWRMKDILSGACFLNEAYNYAFVGEKQLSKLGIDHSNYIRLANPLSSQHALLRQSLAPNLLLSAIANQARFEQIGLFEIGNVFLPIGGSDPIDAAASDNLLYQEKRLAIVLARSVKDRKEKNFALYQDMKGKLELFLASLGLECGYAKTENHPNWADSEMAAEIEINGHSMGLILQADRTIAKKYGLKKDAAFLEIPVANINKALKGKRKFYRELSKYPPVVRDLAFVVGDSVSYADLKRTIEDFHEYVYKVELFDIYGGSKLGAGRKNLAFHVVYQAYKTLQSKEVDEMQAGLFKILEEKFEAVVRDF